MKSVHYRLFCGSGDNYTNVYDDSVPLRLNNFGMCENYTSIRKVDRPNGRMDYQLLCLLSPSEFIINGEKQSLPPQSAVLLYPGEAQHYRFPENAAGTYYWIHFTGSYAKQLLEGLNIHGSVFNIVDSPSVVSGFKAIYESCLTDKSYHDFEILSNLVMILTDIARLSESRGKNIFEKIVRNMNENPASELTNADYADMCSMSECHFIKSFKKHYGITPHDYKMNRLVEQSRSLLSQSNMKVADIAAELGFDDVKYFHRFFKNKTGYTPIEYRRNSIMTD